MENTHILNLKSEVPFDIRLAVYEKDLEARLNDKMPEGLCDYDGLCLSLPCHLWGISYRKKDVRQESPDGTIPFWIDTEYAFPEISEWLSEDIQNEETRIDFLQKTIAKMKSS